MPASTPPAPPAPRPVRLCLAQINFDPQNPGDHIRRVKEIISQHAAADLIIFPELILHGHPSQEKPEGYLFRHLAVARENAIEEVHRHIRAAGARVIVGELKRRGDLFVNRAACVDQHGVQSYIKTHVHWTENFLAGKRLKCFDTPFGPVGINICFDAAFPEVWRVLALQGAELAVNIAAVPAHFPAVHMRRRIQGAAVFNQMFVAYVNRPGPVFSGGSAVFDPRGEQILLAGAGEAVFEVELDLNQASAWRAEEPTYPHRHPLVYREIVHQTASGGLGDRKNPRKQSAA